MEDFEKWRNFIIRNYLLKRKKGDGVYLFIEGGFGYLRDYSREGDLSDMRIEKEILRTYFKVVGGKFIPQWRETVFTVLDRDSKGNVLFEEGQEVSINYIMKFSPTTIEKVEVIKNQSEVEVTCMNVAEFVEEEW